MQGGRGRFDGQQETSFRDSMHAFEVLPSRRTPRAAAAAIGASAVVTRTSTQKGLGSASVYPVLSHISGDGVSNPGCIDE
jgi:hypothetical protein